MKCFTQYAEYHCNTSSVDPSFNSYLDSVIRTEWHLFRQVDDDWMSLGVLHLEFVGVSVRGGLTT